MSSNSSYNPANPSGSSALGAARYREYKVKSFAQSTSYHVMVMPEKQSGFTSFSDFVPPVRLYRNPKENIASESLAENNLSGETEGLVSSNPKTKKRSQLIMHFEAPAHKALKAEESSPWVLEDSDVKSFTSRLEGGQKHKYVLFVNQGTEFRVLFVNKWYRFSPRLSVSTYQPNPAIPVPNIVPAKKTKEGTPNRLEQRIMTKDNNDADEEDKVVDVAPEDIEGLDFDDRFDDDDDDANGVEETTITPNVNPKTTLTTSGREMKKMLRHLDKTNLYPSDEDELEMSQEDYPSYSSEDDIASEDDKSVPKQDKEESTEITKTSSTSAKKIKTNIPAISTESICDIDSGTILAEADLFVHLKKGPIKVKDLILLLKGPLKANLANKEIFKELIKKLCTVKLGTADEEKWLTLKSSFKQDSSSD